MARITAIVAMAILALACNDVKSGTVTSKEHQAAYTYVQVICAGYGKNGACTVYAPQIISVPESWSLCLREGDDSGKPIKDRSTGCVDVSSTDWDRYHIGGHYP
jgi:hypothetical protein